MSHANKNKTAGLRNVLVSFLSPWFLASHLSSHWLAPPPGSCSNMALIFWIIACLQFVISVRSQVTCENYGVPINSSACACPPGFGGPTCSAPACGGDIFEAAQRPLVSGASATSFGNISTSTCACPAGWSGTGCNVCQASTVCQSSFDAANGGAGGAIIPDQNSLNNTLTCSASPRIYAAGEMSCAVIVRVSFHLRRVSYTNIRIESHSPSRVSVRIESNDTPHSEHLLDASAQFHLLRSLGFCLCTVVVRRRRAVLLRCQWMQTDRAEVKRCNLVMLQPRMHLSSWNDFLRWRKLESDCRHRWPRRRAYNSL
jgi:hypothetical protein